MGLLTQQTDLKSLKYGKDRFDGGSSVQPFIKFPTPNGPSLPEAKFGRESLIGQTGGVDQLTRGGSLLGESIANDLSRIGRFLLTPQGLQFIAKQQGLIMGQNKQLYGDDTALWPIEYDPLSILTNVAGVGVGNHFPNVTFKFGKRSDTTNIPRESLYREGNTYQLNSVRKTATPSALIDNITYQPLYIANQPNNKTAEDLKDTVNFYISKINNDGSGNNTYIHFRSYISGLSDNFKADWGSHKYMGRGENFYYYNGFSRDINFKFQIPVMSKYEQSSVYSKLNYLASLMAPDYVSTGGINQGFMRGNLVRLTLGDYLVDVPGIIQGISYTQNDDAGWDIAKNALGNPTTIKDADTGGWVMPKLIEVSGFSFTPIHDFIPKTVSEKFVESGNGTDNDAPFISFGKSYKQPATKGGYGYSLGKYQFPTPSTIKVADPVIPATTPPLITPPLPTGTPLFP